MRGRDFVAFLKESSAKNFNEGKAWVKLVPLVLILLIVGAVRPYLLCKLTVLKQKQ